MSTSKHFDEHSVRSSEQAFCVSSPKLKYELNYGNKSNIATSFMTDASKVVLEVKNPKNVEETLHFDNNEANILERKHEPQTETVKSATEEVNSNQDHSEGLSKSLQREIPNLLDSLSAETIHRKKNQLCEIFFDKNQLPEASKKRPRAKPLNSSNEAELEDGEVTGNDENDMAQTTFTGSPNICRFFLRKTCTWGNKCRFEHPTSNNYGNYVMFEKKELPVPVSPIMSSEAWHPYSPDRFTDSESSFDRNLHCVKQMMHHAGYFPSSQTRKHRANPPTVTFSFNESAPFYPQFQPCSSVERVALLPTPKNKLDLKNKGPNTISTPCKKSRSPQLSPKQQKRGADKRHNRHVWSDPWMSSKSTKVPRQKSRRSNRNSSSASSDSLGKLQTSRRSKPSVYKGRSFSPKSLSARSSRRGFGGPRTPSPSPPRKLMRDLTNASRKRRLICSSSSSCTDLSSTSYDSTTNSSSSKDSNMNRRRTSKRKTLSRKSSSATVSTDKHKKMARSKSCSSKKSRQEYLLMKLLVVEEQIAKKKKKMQ